MAESANGWPIETAPPGEAALGSLVWRREGALSATAIMKCTFSMVHEAFSVPTTPRDIERADRP